MAKEVRINVRTKSQIKRDLEITASLRGLTVSALVNSLVVKAIREEKEREPGAFKPKIESNAEIVGRAMYPELKEADQIKQKPKIRKAG